MKKLLKSFKVYILSVVMIILISLFFYNRNSSTVANNPNVIIIVADALRKDVLGCYGGNANTPHIDWLAKNGVMFENAYSTAPCTLPSSVSLLTGNYSRAYGIVELKKNERDDLKGKNKKNLKRQYSYYVNNKEKLLAEVLKMKGYDVLANVENKIAARSNNFQGFSFLKNKMLMDKSEIARVERELGIQDINRKSDSRISYGYQYLYGMLYYLLTVPKKQNFFLFKWFLDPHAPYNPMEKFRKRIPLQQQKLAREANFYSENRLRVFKSLIKENKFSNYEHFYLKSLYKAEVESIDQQVGYIIKSLKIRGLLEKTFVIFTSDHGECFGEHGHLGHGNSFIDPMIHIPLIIVGPNIPHGKRENTVVSHLDLMPTLKDLLNIKYNDQMKGRSYRPLFNGNSIQKKALYFDRISHFISLNSESDAMMVDGYKLIVSKKNNHYDLELFNITDEPDELNDISGENSKITKKIFKKILKIRKENKLRLKQNLVKIDKNVNLILEMKKTREHLKSLGYLE